MERKVSGRQSSAQYVPRVSTVQEEKAPKLERPGSLGH